MGAMASVQPSTRCTRSVMHLSMVQRAPRIWAGGRGGPLTRNAKRDARALGAAGRSGRSGMTSAGDVAASVEARWEPRIARTG